ncbi:MAG: hypothetical protein FWE62_03590 [Firmicutes bacterium]|nr:hypothetical protein [Bacillota bacterium]
MKNMLKYEKINYWGLDDTIRMSNGAAELLIPTALGIRILSYRLAGGENVFKVFEDQIQNKDKPEWQLFGGHRLWTSPEQSPRTYEIDGAPLESAEITADGLLLTQRTDAVSRIQKRLLVKLDETTARVALTHMLTNAGQWPVRLAPWALTVLRHGGFCAAAQPARFNQLLPDRSVVLWPYAGMNDPRVTWGGRVVSVKTARAERPFKFGCFCDSGAAVYVIGNTVFRKNFGADKTLKYPDFNVNFECYTNNEMLECESLGPLSTLEHGESAEWIENWSLSEAGQAPAYNDEPGILKLLEQQ